MKKIIINLISLSIIVMSLIVIKIDREVNLSLDSDSLYYLNEYSVGVINRVDSENSVNCNLSGVSNSILRLLDDGYIIKSEVYEVGYLDVILIKNEDVYRLHYASDGDFTSIAKPYKNSNIPITYINGKEE